MAGVKQINIDGRVFAAVLIGVGVCVAAAAQTAPPSLLTRRASRRALLGLGLVNRRA